MQNRGSQAGSSVGQQVCEVWLTNLSLTCCPLSKPLENQDARPVNNRIGPADMIIPQQQSFAGSDTCGNPANVSRRFCDLMPSGCVRLVILKRLTAHGISWLRSTCEHSRHTKNGLSSSRSHGKSSLTVCGSANKDAKPQQRHVHMMSWSQSFMMLKAAHSDDCLMPFGTSALAVQPPGAGLL